MNCHAASWSVVLTGMARVQAHSQPECVGLLGRSQCEGRVGHDVLGEEAGGHGGVVPHGDLALFVERLALVEAGVGSVVFAGVVEEVDVEVQRFGELGLIDLRCTDGAVVVGQPPGATEGVEHGGEGGAEVAPAGLAAQADAGHLVGVDLASNFRDLVPGGSVRHVVDDVRAVHHERRLGVERRGVELTVDRETVAHGRDQVVDVVGVGSRRRGRSGRPANRWHRTAASRTCRSGRRRTARRWRRRHEW